MHYSLRNPEDRTDDNVPAKKGKGREPSRVMRFYTVYERYS